MYHLLFLRKKKYLSGITIDTKTQFYYQTQNWGLRQSLLR